MTAVRITAQYVAPTKKAPTQEWYFTLDAILEGNRLKERECFGSVSKKAGDETVRWPFALRLENEKWVLDYGSESGWPSAPTDIFSRDIAPGSDFTVIEVSDGEGICKIIGIDPL